MKISIDDKELFSFSEIHKKVIKNDIDENIFEEEMARRLKYILIHKYEQCLQRLKIEWLPKLKDRVDSIPTDDDKLAELIFSQPDYKNRAQRELENGK